MESDNINIHGFTFNDGKLYEDGELIGDIIEILDDAMAVNSCSEKYGKNKIVFFKRIDMNL